MHCFNFLTLSLLAIIQIQDTKLANNNYNQNKYTVTLERLETTYVNHDLFEYFDIKSGRTTRKAIALYGCAKSIVDIDVAKKLLMTYIFKKKASNRYLFTGMRGQLEIMDVIKHNTYGVRKIITEMTNITFPIKRGVYCLNDYAIFSNKLPPLIPKGQYVMESTYYYDNVKAIHYNQYVRIAYSELYTGPQ